jgi:ParB family transcriptional regulator, chromosome partitioning protein
MDTESKNSKLYRLPVDKIGVRGKRRHLNRRKCELIAESIRTIGLKTPITVHIRKDGKIFLVAGLHRLEAMKLIGEKEIDCIVVKDKRLKRELWQDGENIWRAALTALEKAEGTARALRNVKELEKTDVNTAVKGGKQPGDKGFSKSARSLGLSRETIRRAISIDRISPEAKEAAKEFDLDRNQHALIKVTKESTPEAQVQKVHDLATKPEHEPHKLSSAERKQFKKLKLRLEKAKRLRRALSNATPFVRRKFASEIVKLGRSARPTKSASSK